MAGGDDSGDEGELRAKAAKVEERQEGDAGEERDEEEQKKEEQRKRIAEKQRRNAELAKQAIMQAQQLAARQAQASAQDAAASATKTGTAPQLASRRNAKATATSTQAPPASSSATQSGNDDSDEFFIPDPKKNPHVYVTGLPLDTNEEEFYDFMKKCGVIAEDDEGHAKIQLYRDEAGNVKGDGKCTYLRVESVTLALQLLDETDYRDGNIVHLERAKFRKKDIERKRKMQQKQEEEQQAKDKAAMMSKRKPKKKTLSHKLLGWHDTDLKRQKAMGVLILRHMFDPRNFDKSPLLVDELKKDIENECRKFGPIKKLELFDRNPEGVVKVKYQEEASLGPAIATLNGRWFDGRQIVAEEWDGKEKFKVEETEEVSTDTHTRAREEGRQGATGVVCYCLWCWCWWWWWWQCSCCCSALSFVLEETTDERGRESLCVWACAQRKRGRKARHHSHVDDASKDRQQHQRLGGGGQGKGQKLTNKRQERGGQ